jgi:hypothetical protein
MLVSEVVAEMRRGAGRQFDARPLAIAWRESGSEAA